MAHGHALLTHVTHDETEHDAEDDEAKDVRVAARLDAEVYDLLLFLWSLKMEEIGVYAVVCGSSHSPSVLGFSFLSLSFMMYAFDAYAFRAKQLRDYFKCFVHKSLIIYAFMVYACFVHAFAMGCLNA